MRLSGPAYSIGFTLCYVLTLALELPVLGYYPLTGDWSFQDHSAQAGTAMHWYGLIFTALLAGLLVSTIGMLPRRSSIPVSNKLEQQLAGLGLVLSWLGMIVCASSLSQYFV